MVPASLLNLPLELLNSILVRTDPRTVFKTLRRTCTSLADLTWLGACGRVPVEVEVEVRDEQEFYCRKSELDPGAIVAGVKIFGRWKRKHSGTGGGLGGAWSSKEFVVGAKMSVVVGRAFFANETDGSKPVVQGNSQVSEPWMAALGREMRRTLCTDTGNSVPERRLSFHPMVTRVVTGAHYFSSLPNLKYFTVAADPRELVLSVARPSRSTSRTIPTLPSVTSLRILPHISTATESFIYVDLFPYLENLPSLTSVDLVHTHLNKDIVTCLAGNPNPASPLPTCLSSITSFTVSPVIHRDQVIPYLNLATFLPRLRTIGSLPVSPWSRQMLEELAATESSELRAVLRGVKEMTFFMTRWHFEQSVMQNSVMGMKQGLKVVLPGLERMRIVLSASSHGGWGRDAGASSDSLRLEGVVDALAPLVVRSGRELVVGSGHGTDHDTENSVTEMEPGRSEVCADSSWTVILASYDEDTNPEFRSAPIKLVRLAKMLEERVVESGGMCVNEVLE
ncbi:hypothetical protein HDU93_005585 [Gonapodya sp. JEL0774]|nr:hypothetical protein HDU93_005585 [Gonapodya sp. JEL0774]